MPRVRPRCIFLYFVSVFGCFCVIFNIHQVYYSLPIMLPPLTPTGRLDLGISNTHLLQSSNYVIPENLPYFMKKGSVKPSPDSENRSRRLFPEEDPGKDRIIGKYLTPHQSSYPQCQLSKSRSADVHSLKARTK